MDLLSKSVEILLGVSITGVVSGIVWLTKWCDRLGLENHDLRRDVAHLQRQYQALSMTVAELDKQDEKIMASARKSLNMIDRRFIQIETRLYVIEFRSASTIRPEDETR